MLNISPNYPNAMRCLLAALLIWALPGQALAEKMGYGDALRLIDESPQGQEELKKLEDEFAGRNRDIKGRMDLMLDSVLPTISDARRLGVYAQIRPLFPSLTESPGYLFFSQKPGHEDLAKRFSAALKEFKGTDAYVTIKERYGL